MVTSLYKYPLVYVFLLSTTRTMWLLQLSNSIVSANWCVGAVDRFVQSYILLGPFLNKNRGKWLTHSIFAWLRPELVVATHCYSHLARFCTRTDARSIISSLNMCRTPRHRSCESASRPPSVDSCRRQNTFFILIPAPTKKCALLPCLSCLTSLAGGEYSIYFTYCVCLFSTYA